MVQFVTTFTCGELEWKTGRREYIVRYNISVMQEV